MSKYGGYYFDINGNSTEKPKNMKTDKLTVEKIEKLLENKDIDSTLRENLEAKKKILATQQTVRK